MVTFITFLYYDYKESGIYQIDSSEQSHRPTDEPMNPLYGKYELEVLDLE